ncbi:Coenzyme Q-binding protein COQ10 [Yarrowia sp. E02]|nr:Coenzyme Q-binding protein COQ10 [Yarrowia sp. E02]
MLATLRRTPQLVTRLSPCRSFFSLPKSGPTNFSFTKRFNYPPSLVYGVVSDIQHYSEFVPYCEGSTITKRDQQGNPSEASLKVGWNQFNEDFVSCVECVKDKSVLSYAPNHSFFDILYSKWTITPSDSTHNACDLQLDIEFQFKNSLYNMVSSQFAPAVSEIMVDAFTKRAHAVALEEKRKLT